MTRPDRVPPFTSHVSAPEKEDDRYYIPTINRGAAWVIVMFFLALIGVAVFAWFFPMIATAFSAGFLAGHRLSMHDYKVEPIDPLHLQEDAPK